MGLCPVQGVLRKYLNRFIVIDINSESKQARRDLRPEKYYDKEHI
jgi:hypothetical protein